MKTDFDLMLDRAVSALRGNPMGVNLLSETLHTGKKKGAVIVDTLAFRGVIKQIRHGKSNAVKWALTEEADRLERESAEWHASIREAYRLRENAAKAERKKKYREKWEAKIAAEIESGVDTWPIVRRILPANEAPPVKRGPASVWELAA